MTKGFIEVNISREIYDISKNLKKPKKDLQKRENTSIFQI